MNTQIKRPHKPVVALVGRPNVGKSTLFNRFVGQRKAIIEDLAGTTRDRLYGEADWAGRDFIVVDTGGLDFGASEETAASVGFTAGISSRLFLDEIRAQVQIAMSEAEVIVFVVDTELGITATDEEIANLLRRADKPVVLAVNKADNQKRRQEAVEFYALGFDEPIAVSALHGTGTGDLLDAVVGSFPVTADIEDEDESIKIAIVGRPNVGKSSLLNKILGEDRVIVSNVPGTTRDAIDMLIEYEGIEVTLIDTAGIRRRGKIEPGVEKYSFLRSIKAVSRADVCLLVIDAGDKVTAQDAHVAGYILEEGKSVLVIVNKWDTIDEKDTYTINQFTQEIRAGLQFLDYVPLLFISAKTGQRVNKVLPLALRIQEDRLRRIPTGQLNRLVHEAVAQNPPKGGQRQRLRFFYATQARTDPPTFIFFVNDRELVHFSYQRYLENKIREQYEFLGTPLRLIFRNRSEKK